MKMIAELVRRSDGKLMRRIEFDAPEAGKTAEVSFGQSTEGCDFVFYPLTNDV